MILVGDRGVRSVGEDAAKRKKGFVRIIYRSSSDHLVDRQMATRSTRATRTLVKCWSAPSHLQVPQALPRAKRVPFRLSYNYRRLVICNNNNKNKFWNSIQFLPTHISIPSWLLPPSLPSLPSLPRLEDQIRFDDARPRSNPVQHVCINCTITPLDDNTPTLRHLFGKQSTSSGRFNNNNVRNRCGYQI